MGARRVLLTADESTGSLAAARALRLAGHQPWVTLSRSDAYVALSRAVNGVVRVPAPSSDPDSFVAAVAAASIEVEADAVLPATEPSLRALTGRSALFAGVPLGVSTPEALATATDKSLLPALCRRVGLSTPTTSPAHAVDPQRLTYPAIVKPTESVAARDGGTLVHTTAEVVSGPVQLETLLRRRNDEDLLVQPYLTGQLSAVCGVAWKGELVCAVHQTSPRIWPPHRGISSFAVTVLPDTELEHKVGRLVGLVGWSGVFGLQYLRTCEGPVVLDLNPRIYGSMALAVAAGVNLPAIWLDLLLGDEPAVPAYRVGVHYRVEETDPRAVAVLASQGHYRAALAGLLPRQHTVHAVFSWRDPRPSVVTLHKLFHRGRSALPRPSRTAGIVASSTRASSSSDRLRT